MTTRGIRNNNPGNIRRSATKWQGQAFLQLDDSFVQFKTMPYGVRALGKTLLTYQVTHGLHSIASIISRWAPPSENNTQAYIDAVVKSSGFQADATINLYYSDTLIRVARAIILHENGATIAEGDLSQGCTLALARN